MASPASLSLKNFSATAKTSVAKALEAHTAAFPKPNYTIGFIPPWWLGIIIINPDEKVTLADAQKLAADVQSGIGRATPTLTAATAGTPSVVYGGGHIICGFIRPPDLMSVIEE
jgi:hypothetical protein